METGDPDLVFFNIVDARPERKHQVKTKHLAQKSSTLVVSSFEGVFVGDGTSVQMIHRGGTAVIDILGVCYPEALREIMMCLHRWQPSDGKRMLTFLPKERFCRAVSTSAASSTTARRLRRRPTGFVDYP